jgi:antitoxin VapB
MALIIEDKKAERWAQELAREAGEPVSQAVATAVKERLERIRPRQPRKPRREVIEAICRDFQSLPDLDPRSPEEILGYDSQGLL